MITEFATEGFLNAYSIQQYKLNILKNRFRDFVISSYLKSAMFSEMFKNSKINTLSPEELKNSIVKLSINLVIYVRKI